MAFFKKGFHILHEKYGDNHPYIGGLYSNIAACHHTIGDHKRAMKLYLKALEIHESLFGGNHVSVAKLLSNISALNKQKGAYFKALEYEKRALKIKVENLGERHIDVATSLNNIGNIFLNINDYESALNKYQKALGIRRSELGSNHIEVANSLLSIGHICFKKGDFECAIEKDKEALQIYQNISPGHPNIGTLYHNLAGTYKKRGQIDLAINYCEKAYSLREKSYLPWHEEVVSSRVMLSELFADKGEFRLSSRCIEEAASDLGYSIRSLEFDSVRNHLGLRSVLLSRIGLLKAKKGKARNKDAKSLLNEISTGYNELLILEDVIRTDYSTKADRGFHITEVMPIYEGALETFIYMDDNYLSSNRALSVSEESKSRLLAGHLQSISDDIRFGIPDSMRIKEHNLNVDIAYVEKQIHQAQYEQFSQNDSLIDIYNDRAFKLKRKRDELVDTFRVRYKRYFRLKYRQQSISIIGVQDSLLNEGQVLLEYFVGDSSIFTFTITKDSFQIKQSPKNFPLKQQVQNLRESIYKPYHTEDLTDAQRDSLDQRYRESAYLLYEKLIQPVEDMIPEDSELIIVPDGVLGYIPFDALLTEPVEAGTKVRDYPYMLKKYQTSIAYSATLLKEMQDKQHKRPAARSFLGVAPHFDGVNDSARLASRFIDYANERNRLYALEENIPEVTALQSLIGGDLLTDTFATKSAFLERASDYRILHLSTHGKANDEAGDYSFLAFYRTPTDSTADDWLYNRELYNMQLNADMVVLSACETGIGELQRGEGIISLARGFSYAGAKSIITSLWTVNDKEAPVLMESFYKYLKEGYSKDAALRQAKLDYLESSPRPAPYYWASFIPIGDMQPIELQEGAPWWVWGLIIVGLFAVFLYWRSRKAA